MGILSIIILLTFAVCIISGAGRGFLRILFSVLTLVVCLFCASHFSTQAETFLKEKTTLYQTMNSSVYSAMPENSEEETQDIQSEAQDQTDAISGVLLGGISSDESLPSVLIEGINQTVASIRNTIVSGIVDTVTQSLFSALVRIGIFFIAWLIMKLLYAVLSARMRGRAVGGVNRLLGAALGAVEALLISWLILSVVTFGQNDSSSIVTSITGEPLLKWLFQTDPFLQLTAV